MKMAEFNQQYKPYMVILMRVNEIEMPSSLAGCSERLSDGANFLALLQEHSKKTKFNAVLFWQRRVVSVISFSQEAYEACEVPASLLEVMETHQTSLRLQNRIKHTIHSLSSHVRNLVRAFVRQSADRRDR